MPSCGMEQVRQPSAHVVQIMYEPKVGGLPPKISGKVDAGHTVERSVVSRYSSTHTPATDMYELNSSHIMHWKVIGFNGCVLRQLRHPMPHVVHTWSLPVQS
jgi:hypothetical protein